MSQKVLLMKNITNALICAIIAFFVRYFSSELFKLIPNTLPTFFYDIQLANHSVAVESRPRDNLKNTLIYDSLLCSVVVFIAIFLQTLIVQLTKASIFKYTPVNNIMTGAIVGGIRYALFKTELLQKIPSHLPIIGGMHYLNESPRQTSTVIIYKVICAVSMILKKIIAIVMCAEVKI